MDPRLRGLEALNFGIFVGLFAIALMAFILVAMRTLRPRHLTVFLGAWMAFAQFDALALGRLARLFGIVPLLLLAVSAFREAHGPCRISQVPILYLTAAFVSLFAVVGADDGFIAIIVRLQLIVVIVACIGISCLARTREDLLRILLRLSSGHLLGLFVGVAGAISSGNTDIFVRGRFSIFGSSPNSLPLMTALAVLTLIWVSFEGIVRRKLLIPFAVLGGLSVTLLSASRAAIFVLVIGLAALIVFGGIRSFHTFARRVSHAVAITLVLLVASQAIGVPELWASERLTQGRFVTRSSEIVSTYWHYTEGQRFVGHLFQSDFTADRIPGFTHSHNTFMDFFYLAGIAALLPVVAGIVLTFVYGFRSSGGRRAIARREDRFIAVALLGALVAQGMVTRTLLYPTSIIPVYFLLLSFSLIPSPSRSDGKRQTKSSTEAGSRLKRLAALPRS